MLEGRVDWRQSIFWDKLENIRCFLHNLEFSIDFTTCATAVWHASVRQEAILKFLGICQLMASIVRSLSFHLPCRAPKYSASDGMRLEFGRKSLIVRTFC